MAAAQIPPSTYGGHYSHSSLRPVSNYVSRRRLHQKIKEQLHDLKDDGVEDVRILVVGGLGEAGKSQLVLNSSANIDRTTLLCSRSKLDRKSRSNATMFKSTDSSTVIR